MLLQFEPTKLLYIYDIVLGILGEEGHSLEREAGKTLLLGVGLVTPEYHSMVVKLLGQRHVRKRGICQTTAPYTSSLARHS